MKTEGIKNIPTLNDASGRDQKRYQFSEKFGERQTLYSTAHVFRTGRAKVLLGCGAIQLLLFSINSVGNAGATPVGLDW